MKTFRLTLAQLRNLKELRDDLEGKLPPTILTKVPPRQLARWLRNPPFRDRVEALLEVVRFRQDNALDLAATRAAEQISAALGDKAGIDTPELRPLAEIIKLALAARSSKARRQRTAENSKNRRNEKNLQPPATVPPGPAPIHADVSADEARELVRRLMEGRQ